MGAEPRDVVNADLDGVATHTEQRAHQKHIGTVQAGQRLADIFAGLGHVTVRQVRVRHHVVPLVCRIGCCGRTTCERDVRSEERAEGDIVEPDTAACRRLDAEGGKNHEAGETEGVVAADSSTQRSTTSSGDQSK